MFYKTSDEMGGRTHEVEEEGTSMGMAKRREFMIRLKIMIEYVKRNNKTLKMFCPGTIYVTLPHRNDKNLCLDNTNSYYDFCTDCHDVMKSGRHCPCNIFTEKHTNEIAEREIEEYFRKEEA